MDKISIFREGCLILDPIFIANGFKFYKGPDGQSSGGSFVSGSYKKTGREFHFSYRYSLGDIYYQIGDSRIDHTALMKFLSVESKYPGFEKEPLESFKNLALDLENHCQNFLSGNGEDIVHCAKEFKKNPNIFKGFNQLP